MRLKNRRDLLALCGLVAATYLVHFLLLPRFGLYEDDYLYIARPMTQSWAQVQHYLLATLTHWPQGRPLGLSIPVVVAYLGNKFGGLDLVYLIGYAVIATNVALAFVLLRRLAPLLPAVAGALVFCLYPADTTKIFLTHSLCLQTAWTFALLAALAWLDGRTRLFYVLAFLPLIIYESMILPLFAIPLLRAEASRVFARRYARHVMGLLLLVAVYALVRYFLFEEGRLTGTLQGSPLDLAVSVFSSVAVGPLLSAATFLSRPVTLLTHSNVSAWIFTVVFFMVTLIALRFSVRTTETIGPSGVSPGESSLSFTASGLSVALRLEYPGVWGNAGRLVLTGLVMWPLSYLLAFTHWPPEALAGRTASATHMAAALSAPLVITGLLSLVFAADGPCARCGPRARRWATAGVSLYLSLLAGFQFLVQQDYAEGWKRQKEFWRQVVTLTPDIDERSVVVVPDGSLQNTEANYIMARSWGNLITFYYLYNFENAFRTRTPRVAFLDQALARSLMVVNGQLYWEAPRFAGGYIDSARERIDPRNIIVLRLRDGKMERYIGVMNATGGRVRIREARAATNYETTAVYDVIMDQE